jgi:hypothetical protein
MRRCKERPRNQRRLPAALIALIEIARRHQTILFFAAACRVLEATRSACRDHDRLVLLLGAVLLFERSLAEALLELHDVTSHGLDLIKQHEIPAPLSGVLSLREVRIRFFPLKQQRIGFHLSG